ncbi:MAG: GntR family transcriptional regulator [Acidobacteria bacterium]|nr:GntR family transcriptional regulator [Acidobacteriota bacterium]
MLITVDPADPRPLYVQIMDEIRRALVLGSLEPEEPLPSVRQLAAKLRLNPNTVQQAYRELEREGVVYVRRGLGTFAASREIDDGAERRQLAEAVAERALLDAHRNGLSADELVDTLRRLADDRGHDITPREGGRAAATRSLPTTKRGEP